MPSEPVRDLERESCLATPEATVQVAVRVAEQERGLELQVNAPEFTLATTLPVVNVNEAAMALNIEACLAKPEATDNEPVRDLNREDLSTRPEPILHETLKLSRRLLA